MSLQKEHKGVYRKDTKDFTRNDIKVNIKECAGYERCYREHVQQFPEMTQEFARHKGVDRKDTKEFTEETVSSYRSFSYNTP